MNLTDDGFLKELLGMFRIEAEEHLKTISSGLVDLEKTRKPEEKKDILECVFREAHSLKGAARAVNLVEVETLCQTMESLFSEMKQNEIRPGRLLFDTLLEAVDTLSDLIESPDKPDISDLMHRMNRLLQKENADTGSAAESEPDAVPDAPAGALSKETGAVAEAPDSGRTEENRASDTEGFEKPAEEFRTEAVAAAPEEKKVIFSDTVRIPTHKLDVILRQAEEMVGAKMIAMQQSADLREMALILDFWKKEWEKILPGIKAMDQALCEGKKDDASILAGDIERLRHFVMWNSDQFKLWEDRILPMAKLAETNSRQLNGMVDGLLDEMKTILMLPFSTLLKIIPKVVRDLSRDQGKDVDLVVKGSTIEIDRRILEELKDPFIHLLRNSVDHGLEKPGLRKKSGKPAAGSIRISIAQMEGSKVEILISDDGRGIDTDQVKTSAVRKGIVSQAQADKMTETEVLGLIFQSDVSTSPIITDISGRGLGLAIVREKVEKLGGMISLDTRKGEGTTFRIVLPVTLATFRGIIVRVSGHPFVIPTANVERVVRLSADEVKTVENRETVSIQNQIVSLLWMHDVLALSRKERAPEKDFLQILVMISAERRIAFVVDEISNEQEVLVKGLGKHLARVRHIAGATILGTGKVVPILNVSDLMKTAVHVNAAPERGTDIEEDKKVRKSILIAEDSITSRTLLKNILETAGYTVKATVDGVDAFTELRSGVYDLVVSDVEMPRMNGFELVSRIRANQGTSEMPVILVTGLESREDRERGIDVGANAYIVKRSFDQSNLLEVIEKLI